MKNARVERRQLHAMLFGQFRQIQISKFSAGLRGDSSRRKIVPGINRQRCFRRNSERAFLQICGSARNGNVSPLLIRKKPSSLIGQVAVCFPRNQRSTLALILMVPPDCGNQHVDIKEVGHGGNCSSALKISSREIGRPMESSERFPFRRMIRTLVPGFSLWPFHSDQH